MMFTKTITNLVACCKIDVRYAMEDDNLEKAQALD